MNTQEKKEALVQAVEEIAKKEAAYWEGNPKMQETFQNCYVSTAKTTTKFLESGEAYVFTGDIAAMWLRDSSAQVVHSERISDLKRDGKRTDRPSGKICTY